MKRASVLLLILLAIAVSAAAAPSVAGDWTVTVPDSPHGAMTMGLTLKQDGTKISGTFSSGHMAGIAVSGEFANSELKLETAGAADEKIVFNAKMKDDGTLAGYLSSPMGDMKWTASRAEAKGGK
jgi:hypothetical protein